MLQHQPIKRIKIFVLFLLLGGILLSSAKNANAEQFGIGVYPPILQIQSEPPASVNAKISVQNQTDQSATYSIFLVPFRASEEGNGVPQYEEKLDDLYKRFFNRVQIMDGEHPIEELTLGPRQGKDLSLRVGLPKSEQSGEYYFTIFFITKESGDLPKTSSLGTKGGVGVNVLFQVGPKTPPRGFIKEFSSPSFVSKGPVEFKVELQNSGQSYFNAKGTILIKNIFGQTIGQVELKPTNVLTNSSRLLGSAESSDNNPKAVWNEKFLLGFYSADLTLSLSDQGPILRKQTRFSAFPLEGVLGIIIAGAIVLIIVQRIRSKRG